MKKRDSSLLVLISIANDRGVKEGLVGAIMGVVEQAF